MENTVLIKSIRSKKLVKIFYVCFISLMILGLILFLAIPAILVSSAHQKHYDEYLLEEKENYLKNYEYKYDSFEEYLSEHRHAELKYIYISGEKLPYYSYTDIYDTYDKFVADKDTSILFNTSIGDTFYVSNIFNYIGIVVFAIGLSFLLTYLILLKCTLEINEVNVKGKTLFGKSVVLPIYKVSAYSTRKFLSTITIASSAGKTRFSFIYNYKEIAEVLDKLIAKKQTEPQPVLQTANIEDLVKLKEYLDSGIITQDEYEQMKKQILRL